MASRKIEPCALNQKLRICKSQVQEDIREIVQGTMSFKNRQGYRKQMVHILLVDIFPLALVIKISVDLKIPMVLFSHALIIHSVSYKEFPISRRYKREQARDQVSYNIRESISKLYPTRGEYNNLRGGMIIDFNGSFHACTDDTFSK